MSIVRSKLFETPDEYRDESYGIVSWSDIQFKPITFGWYEGILYIKEVTESGSYNAIHARLIPNNDNISREDFDYAGRLWLKTKVISFWQYPSKDKLEDLLLDLSSKINVDIINDPEWRIEIKIDDNGTFNDYKLIKILDYIGSKKLTTKELQQQHAISPLLKQNRSNPGKYHVKKKPLAWRQAMYAESKKEIVKSKLNESPDNITIGNKYIEWDNTEYLPVTFGFYNDKLYWSDEIINRNGDYPGARNYGNKNERVLTHHEIAIKHDVRFNDEDRNEEHISRRDFTYPGRLWRRVKVISFWKHPEKEDMQNVLKIIGDEVGENILGDPEWKVEIFLDNFEEEPTQESKYQYGWNIIPVSEYTGSDKISNRELQQDHIKSPLLKQNSSGAGKYHVKTKPLAWRQAMYAEGKLEIVKAKLFENPDEITYNGNYYTVIDKESKAYPFTIITNNKKIEDVIIGKMGKYHQDDKKTSGQGVYPGRIYTAPKILTFWVYPNEKELIEIIKIIESKLDLKILNNDWKIEVYNDASKGTQSFWNDYDRNSKSSIIPIEDYIGSENVSSEEYEEHTKSPLLKRPKNSAAYKYQKNLKNKKPLAWRQAMYAESVKDKLSYDRKIN